MVAPSRANDAKPGVSEVHDALLDGAECMLNFAGGHFLVTVLDVNTETVRVSFPARDYPIEGLCVALEFHDPLGFVSYGTKVLEGPSPQNETILLQRPADMKRRWHRKTYRIPTDLTVQVRDHGHARRYDAELVDLSVGGARICTEAPFDRKTLIELAMSIPGEPGHTVLCDIMDVLKPDDVLKPTAHQFCLRFIDLDHEAEQSIVRYVRRRLADLNSPAR